MTLLESLKDFTPKYFLTCGFAAFIMALGNDVAPKAVLLCEFGLLIVTLKITLTRSVTSVVNSYQWQCLALALVTAFTAYGRIDKTVGGWGIGGTLLAILILPLGLGALAKFQLLRATETPRDPRSWDEISQAVRVVMNLFRPAAGESAPDKATNSKAGAREDAAQTWRDASEQMVQVQVRDVVAFVALLILAALVAGHFHLPTPDETIGLTVSLTLHLVGLYLMGSKHDLISQTIGLLVMDHGLYLAAVKIVALPVPGLFFVLGLWCYTVITLFILVFLVPQVRLKLRKGIDLDAITRISNLKG